MNKIPKELSDFVDGITSHSLIFTKDLVTFFQDGKATYIQRSDISDNDMVGITCKLLANHLYSGTDDIPTMFIESFQTEVTDKVQEIINAHRLHGGIPVREASEVEASESAAVNKLTTFMSYLEKETVVEDNEPKTVIESIQRFFKNLKNKIKY